LHDKEMPLTNPSEISDQLEVKFNNSIYNKSLHENR
jgi:hypothetical protein